MLEQQVIDILKEIAKGSKDLAPDAIAALSRAILWRCAINLISAALTLIAIIAITFKWFIPQCKRWIAEGVAEKEAKNGVYDIYTRGFNDGGVVCVTVVYSMVAFIITLICFSFLFNFTQWMGVFDQKAYIASEILNRITNH